MKMTSLPQKPLLRVDEVAIYFDVTPRTVYLWITNGKLERVETPGGSIRIPRERVIALTAILKSSSLL
jgi:excisionase family DNA binding protein